MVRGAARGTMPAVRGLLRRRRAGGARPALGLALAALSLLASSATAASGDGGSGSYTAAGASFAFTLENVGTTNWVDFVLIGPPGTTFLGAASQGEITTPCSPGQPDGVPNEVECGPLAGGGLAPGTRLLLIAPMTSAAACGQPFQLEISSSATQSPAAVGVVNLSASCATAPSAPNCAEASGLVSAAGATEAALGQLAEALGGNWPTASSMLAAAETGLRALRGTAGLRGDPAARSSLAAALESAARAAAAVASAQREAAAVRAAGARARGFLAVADSALRACEAGGGQPAAAAGATAAGPECAGENAALAAATAAGRMFDAAKAHFAASALGSVGAELRARARSLLQAASGFPGVGDGQRGRAASAALDAAASLVGAGVERFDGSSASGETGAALRAGQSARASCLAG